MIVLTQFCIQSAFAQLHTRIGRAYSQNINCGPSARPWVNIARNILSTTSVHQLVVSDHDSTVLISSFLNWKYERDFIKRANYSVLRFSDPIHSNPLAWINKKTISYNTSIYFDRTQRIFSSTQNIVPCTKCFAQFLRHGLAQAALMQKIQLNSSSSYWLPFLAAQRSSDNKMR